MTQLKTVGNLAPPTETSMRRLLGDALWLLVVILIGLLGGLPRTAAWALRNWRRRRATTPQAQAEVAWREVLDLADDLGYRAVGEPTLRTTASGLSRQVVIADRIGGRDTAAALSRLALEVEAARYSPAYQHTDTVFLDLTTSLAGLDAGARPHRRRRATWLPRAVFKRRH